jgi:hypothetical protein
LTNCRGWDPDDLSPRLAVKVFEVFLGKLDQYTSRLYAEALNNPNDAVAEEAEAQFAILEDVRQRLGRGLPGADRRRDLALRAGARSRLT